MTFVNNTATLTKGSNFDVATNLKLLLTMSLFYEKLLSLHLLQLKRQSLALLSVPHSHAQLNHLKTKNFVKVR